MTLEYFWGGIFQNHNAAGNVIQQINNCGPRKADEYFNCTQKCIYDHWNVVQECWQELQDRMLVINQMSGNFTTHCTLETL